MKHFVRHPLSTCVLAIALLLASAGAAALGLGQIEVRSRIGQPFLAEIPIISRDPAELEQLSARLASPETFARIGLQPPSETLAKLQFAPALDAAGRPVIRVTSAQPINEPLLTFLVQVDWGQGRLVREYSALVDTPRTLAAPAQPPIESPTVARPDVIERANPPVAAVAPRPPAPAVAPVPEPSRDAEPVRRNAIAVVPPPRPTVVTAPRLAPATGEYGPVKAGESLSQIAGRLDLPGGVSLEHSMIALLRANPAAFIGGNINQLKQGAVLRIPPSSETADIDAREATALVRAQARQWRQSRQAVRPPQAVSAASAGPTLAATAAAAPAVSRTSGARLEIVPPGASQAKRAGTQSGINAGGEGQMLRQELQQTKESLAARDAELSELKGRIADLEKLQADQQQLLSLKDSELAAAQQRLAASNLAAAPAAAQTNAVPVADGAMPAEVSTSSLQWVAGGIGIFVLALLVTWWLRRRAPSTSKFSAPAPMSAESLANAFAPMAPKASQRAGGTPGLVESVDVQAPATDHPAEGGHAPVATSASGSAPEPPAAVVEESPLWNRRERQQLPTGRAETPTAAPAWHVAAADTPSAPVQAADVADVPGSERLELARAYLDLGDRDSARQLLGEVALNGDPDSRQHASRMLQELE